MPHPRFRITRNEKGKYTYDLTSPAGDVVLHYGGYATVAACEHAVAAVRKSAKKDRRFHRRDGVLLFSFVVVDGDGGVIGQGEKYHGALEREIAVMAVRRVALGAEIHAEPPK